MTRSTWQGTNPTPIPYLFLFGLRTRSETRQPERRVQVVKEQHPSKTATKMKLERESIQRLGHAVAPRLGITVAQQKDKIVAVLEAFIAHPNRGNAAKTSTM